MKRLFLAHFHVTNLSRYVFDYSFENKKKTGMFAIRYL